MNENKNNEANAESDDELLISKSSVKRALQDIVTFGEKLLAISPKKLAQLPISDLLQSEIDLAKRLKNDNSRRRQLQRIGKILRSENYEEILDTLNILEDNNRQHHQSSVPTEKWFEELTSESNALARFIDKFADTDKQQLAQLVRNAKKEIAKKSIATKQQQRLYKLIQTTLVSHLK